ncbi:MAG: glycosyltransferase family 87 protein [Candidatus Aminicenantia bacterium]
MKKLKKFFNRAIELKFLLIFYILITIIFSAVEVLKGPKEFEGRLYTHYNNYIIFSKSFFHLIKKGNLYKDFPDEHWDLFKYSPTFALFMGFFAFLPDFAGLILWNLFNSLVLFFSIKLLPWAEEKSKSFILLFFLVDVVTSMQNSQSNSLVAGLVISSFVFFERGKTHLSSLFLIFSFFVKPICFISFLLFLLYPKKIRFIAFSICWFIIFLTLPLVFVPPSHLILLYNSWMSLILHDYSFYEGLSIFGILREWFGLHLPKSLFLFSGITIFLISFTRKKLFGNKSFRISFLSSSLIWSVIFNHKAESPTFIIATSGVALWYFLRERKKIEDKILLIFYFLFTSISSTDLTPLWVKENLIKPYFLKALPSIVLWLRIQLELVFLKYENRD